MDEKTTRGRIQKLGAFLEAEINDANGEETSFVIVMLTDKPCDGDNHQRLRTVSNIGGGAADEEQIDLLRIGLESLKRRYVKEKLAEIEAMADEIIADAEREDTL